mgnify:CR=1 FL=1
MGRDAREIAKLELALVAERSVQQFALNLQKLWPQTIRIVKALCSDCHVVVPEIIETLIAECLSPIDVLDKVETKTTIVPLHEKHIRRK